jgi:gluconate 2-dehydrogenase alpha chain
VTEIVVDRQGRASGVRYVQGGRSFVQPASVVVLATYTHENVRLLLTSTSCAFPTGLADGNGQVGRHYMSHVHVGADGLFPGRKLNRFYREP